MYYLTGSYLTDTKVNTSNTKDTGKEHSGTQTALCTRETGPREKGMVMVYTPMRTGISTKGTGKRDAGTGKGSTSTSTWGLNTKVSMLMVAEFM